MMKFIKPFAKIHCLLCSKEKETVWFLGAASPDPCAKGFKGKFTWLMTGVPGFIVYCVVGKKRASVDF